MSDHRLLLVIGSQCEALNKLSFLPEVAHRLHELLVRPGPGECRVKREAGGDGVGGAGQQSRPCPGGCEGDCKPALEGLLIDPTVDEARAAIECLIRGASERGATLILAYVGHGELPRELSGKFYLMPRDATRATARRAIDFARLVEDCLDDCLRDPGVGLNLLILLDACYAGAGAWQAMQHWALSLQDRLGFELLTATDDRPTANAPLVRAVIELLERGDPDAGERLSGLDVSRLLRRQGRDPQHVTGNADLHLGRNIARDPGDVFWKGCSGWAQILMQTEYFQPTPQLDELVEASRSHPVVVLTGAVGSGKSSLAAALARPEIADGRLRVSPRAGDGRVPWDFTQAIAMLNDKTNQCMLADDLACQLRRSLPGFDGAVEQFERAVPLPEREKLDFLDNKVLKPLEYLADRREARIVLDAFDELPDVTRRAVSKALRMWPSDLRLVITARDFTPDCPPGKVLRFDSTSRESLANYLRGRGVAEAAIGAILDKAQGRWLVARLLAKAVLADREGKIDLARLAGTVAEAYTALLNQAVGDEDWRDRFRPVLGPLAVAGSGPELPVALLARASEALGGPGEIGPVRDVLHALRGLVLRRGAGAPGEHVGLSHPTLSEYLVTPSVAYRIDPQAAHRAMSQAIDALAPMSGQRPDDPLHRYAFLRQAEHLWEINEPERALECLCARESHLLRENLERWKQWLARLNERFVAGHPSVLKARGRLAHWTGEAGDRREGLRQFRRLLRDQAQALDPDHPDTLRTRRDRARWTGQMGDAREAVRQFRALLPDQVRVQGEDDPATLLVRHDLAHWAGEAGDPREAMQLIRGLLPDQVRVHGPDAPSTLGIQHSDAHWTGAAGDAHRAVQLLRDLLPRRKELQGPNHADTLRTRHDLAHWVGEAGDARQARDQLRDLLPDQVSIEGQDHPDTLRTRRGLAHWTGEAGGAGQGLALLRALLPDQVRVLGADHPDTLCTRRDLARWTGEEGDAREALRLLEALLPDQERVLGRGHPETLRIRHDLARWAGQSGDAREALQILGELRPDQANLLGAEHPDTLRTRHDLARWTGEAGRLHEAMEQLAELLPHQERAQGPDHPDTLWTRQDLARWTGEAGDAAGALRLLCALLPDRQRVQGPDHPATLRTRHDIAHWTGEAGDAAGALRLLRELLPDRERAEGRDHPDTLWTRQDLARWTGEAGDAAGALRLLEGLLPDRERAQGPDHPATLWARQHLAHWSGAAGDVPEALRRFNELRPDRERVLGPDHPEVLNTLLQIGRWIIRKGDREAGCRVLRDGLGRAEARFGPDHGLTRQFSNLIRSECSPPP